MLIDEHWTVLKILGKLEIISETIIKILEKLNENSVFPLHTKGAVIYVMGKMIQNYLIVI